MTIYDLLRQIVLSLGILGGMSKQDALNGVDCINRLEAVNALGTTATTTEGNIT